MAQDFPTITATTKLQDSLTPILDRDAASKSNFSGTSFPATDLVLGQPCYRTDQGKLYILKQITPTVVWEALVATGDIASLALSLTGGTMVGDVTFDAKSAQKRIYFDHNATANRRTYFYGTPAEIIGLWTERNAKNAWSYDATTDIFTFGAATVRVGANAVWHAGNDGAGSTLDADLLDGQQGSYYLAWANLTGKPAFTDAATTTVATIQAGVNLSSRVAKTGDEMSGDLTITKAWPIIKWHYPGVRVWYAGGTNDGQWQLVDESAAAQRLRVDTGGNFVVSGGAIWAASYGWLHDRFATKNSWHHNLDISNCGASGDTLWSSTGGNTITIGLTNTNCACACDCGD